MLVTANVFQPLMDVFEAVIKFFHNDIGVGWGLAIVLLTVAIRAIMVPLTLKQFKSMRRLQLLQPELKEIQNKYKQDKQRQQQELMKFYKENNVNPLASCLPLAVQAPVFISLYYMLRQSLRDDICHGVQVHYRAHYAALHHLALSAVQGQTRSCGAGHGASFLFIHDLTNKGSGLTLVILIVFYVGTQLTTQILMRNPAMDKKQQNLMLFLPVVFVLFIFQFPTGLLVYWITSNFWQLLQQLYIRQTLGPPGAALAAATAAGQGGTGARAAPAARSPRPSPAKGSGGAAKAAGANGSGGGSIGDAVRAKLKSIQQPAAVSASPGKEPSSRGSGTSGRGARGGGGTPPPPPRKKKKRSGRRR